ncbi:hypothetical protein [Rugosimonospora africana]|uniref:Uncharacterized protein n=1 Tax=Rugosimonospora africana TaxID=556532 RepID=A0A8J3QZK7_9ACTN|nr:hypothetical protein [Rugosimonospora africana]GIH19139.1 hypothetical protein Raf01_73110 [Rugosimonospora africana]
MVDKPRRKPTPDRARKRAIRAQAARTGVSYLVAARQLGAGAGERPSGNDPYAGMPASRGRTVYPAGSDNHRRWLVECRGRRDFAQRVQDARLAADLPHGRARHLTDRFPPTRGEDGSGAGSLYHGAGRCTAVASLYLVVAHERPDLVPSAGELAWAAELGEETAIDTACAGLDRAARRLLDGGPLPTRTPGDLYPRIEAASAALASSLIGADGTVRIPGRDAFTGARQILDAVLVVADDGHAPGTRVRMLGGPHTGATGTIVGAFWESSGPPSRYEVRPDGQPSGVVMLPGELWVLSRDELTAEAADTPVS